MASEEEYVLKIRAQGSYLGSACDCNGNTRPCRGYVGGELKSAYDKDEAVCDENVVKLVEAAAEEFQIFGLSIYFTKVPLNLAQDEEWQLTVRPYKFMYFMRKDNLLENPLVQVTEAEFDSCTALNFAMSALGLDLNSRTLVVL